MASFPDGIANEVLVRCARHCCICRRFRPLHLQVHHIRERAEGGKDVVENAMPICVSCHADVHTQTKLTRRFTEAELRAHRDAVYQMVADGRLPAPEAEDSVAALSAALTEAIRAASKGSAPPTPPPLTAEATEILLLAVNDTIPINPCKYDGGLTFFVGGRTLSEPGDLRAEAKYRRAMETLLRLDLIEQIGNQLFLTDAGYMVADDLLSAQSQGDA